MVKVDLPGAGGMRIVAGSASRGGRHAPGPRGRVLRGHGSGGRSGMEGVRAGTVIGTYLSNLHAPLLPKNA